MKATVIVTLTQGDPNNTVTFNKFQGAVNRATIVDGCKPVSDQALIDVPSGTRTLFVVRKNTTSTAEPIGYGVYGHGELEFFLLPEYRGYGHGQESLDLILPETNRGLLAWSHGDHPAARVLARHYGFAVARKLLHLSLHNVTKQQTPSRPQRANITIDAFRPGRDDSEWVQLNAKIFEDHPEQGQITLKDLRARMTQNWFDPQAFLVAREDDGTMVGYNWLKITPQEDDAEIYVIGVDPEHAGSGIGRTLMEAGIRYLSQHSIKRVDLYVEANNAGALRLYRSLGFVEASVDIQYRLTSDSVHN